MLLSSLLYYGRAGRPGAATAPVADAGRWLLKSGSSFELLGKTSRPPLNEQVSRTTRSSVKSHLPVSDGWECWKEDVNGVRLPSQTWQHKHPCSSNCLCLYVVVRCPSFFQQCQLFRVRPARQLAITRLAPRSTPPAQPRRPGSRQVIIYYNVM